MFVQQRSKNNNVWYVVVIFARDVACVVACMQVEDTQRAHDVVESC